MGEVASFAMPKPPLRQAASQRQERAPQGEEAAPKRRKTPKEANEPMRRSFRQRDWAIEVAKGARAAVEEEPGRTGEMPPSKTDSVASKPKLSPGMLEAMYSPPRPSAEQMEEEPEPAPEENMNNCDYSLQRKRAIISAVSVALLWWCLLVLLFILKRESVEPECPEVDLLTNPDYEAPNVCEKCGSSVPLVLPLFGEFENSWHWAIRGVLYFVGLLWVFLGVGIVCDQFMAGIEEITAYERSVWVEVHKGTKQKLHIKAWNGTVANLTLMALGSSAPEILLSVIETVTNQYFSGELGPSTIVGSAAFNLLMITAVCISSLPPPDTRKIAGTKVFGITATTSIIAYVWLVIILSIITPSKVDVWEAVATLLMFPILVFLSYLADIGRCRCSKRSSSDAKLQSLAAAIQDKYGKQLPEAALKVLLEQEKDHAKHKDQSRAKLRATATKRMMCSTSASAAQNQGLHFGFHETSHFVLECAGACEVKVVANREPCCTVQMNYRTADGSAKEGHRYKRVEGTLVFGPNMTEKIISVPIVDNDDWETDKDFSVELFDLQVSAGFGHHHIHPTFHNPVVKVVILNDDIPGTLGFAADRVFIHEGELATVGVTRTSGSTGEVSCKYHTVEGGAVSNKDFQPVSGVLKFTNSEVYNTIRVPILRSRGHELESDEMFKVLLTEATGGASIGKDIHGGENCATCEVIILGNQSAKLCQQSLAKCVNRDKIRKFCDSWKGQFASSIYCNGSPEEQASAGSTDWFFHALCLPWKVIFSFVPPPNLFGGWLCFSCALVFIGGVTLVIGELANLLGCVWEIPGDITAITLVAMGTSLPDTFASRVAAQQDSCADNAVGNITGSNAVNVFLGLGLPWTIAALYWEIQGATDDWKLHRYKGESFQSTFGGDYPTGGFIVPAGSLVFSVTVFTACALMCMMLLFWRRYHYGGELGGPKCAQLRDSLILFGMWLVYILCSVINSLNA